MGDNPSVTLDYRELGARKRRERLNGAKWLMSLGRKSEATGCWPAGSRLPVRPKMFDAVFIRAISTEFRRLSGQGGTDARTTQHAEAAMVAALGVEVTAVGRRRPVRARRPRP